jgi:DNA-binding NarL/FixJ family response regulator
MKKIRVIIADDQSLIVEGISIIIGSQPDIEVVATAGNGARAVELVEVYKPDIVLMDIRMPEMNGIEALKEIKARFPKTIVLMLTTFDPDEYILGAFRNGADGYLLKDTSGDKLALAIRDANAGNITIPASIAARIIAQIPKENRKNSLSDYNLTQREAEIAELICKGYRNDQLSREFGISMGTVKNYISSLYSKLEVSRRQEAIDIITGLKNNKMN